MARDWFPVVAIVMSVSSIFLLSLSFIALTDIEDDYVGTLINGPDGRETLPYWTACTLEWSIVRKSFVVIALLQLSVTGFVLWMNQSANGRRRLNPVPHPNSRPSSGKKDSLYIIE